MIRAGELLRTAVEIQAVAIVIAHNHPGGDPTPSPDDVRRVGDLDVARYWADPGGLTVVLDLPPDTFRRISPDMETVEVRAYGVECAGRR